MNIGLFIPMKTKFLNIALMEWMRKNGQYTTNMAHNYVSRMNWTFTNLITLLPLQQKIQLMSNGTRYSVESVQVEAEDHLPHYEPSNT